MKTALYVRTSTDTQSKGLDAQVKALVLYCEVNQITDYTVYSDSGISGSKESRPSLDIMIKDCENGSVSTVIVFSFSRFARSTKALILALERFDSLKIRFISVTESVDTQTAIGKTVFSIIAAIGELERAMIKERVVNGLKAAKARGKKLGASKKFLNINSFTQLNEAGLKTREIAKALNCSQSTVVRVLKDIELLNRTKTQALVIL